MLEKLAGKSCEGSKLVAVAGSSLPEYANVFW
jgi:hypothetical protein